MFSIYEPHPDVMDWYQRAIANGGIISPKSFNICENYVKAIELAGLRSVLQAGHELVFIGSNLAAALTPLYAPVGNNVTPFNFFESDYSESTGLNPGAANSSKYVNTGVSCSSMMAQNSGRLSVYCRSDIASSTYEIGARGSAITLTMALRTCDSNRSTFFVAYDGNASQGTISANNSIPDARGFFCATRSPTQLFVSRNGIGITAKAINTGAVPAAPITLFALNNNSTSRVNWSSKILSHSSIGPYVLLGQTQAQYAAIQAKETALGRAV
jgi:hypothetical protein